MDPTGGDLQSGNPSGLKFRSLLTSHLRRVLSPDRGGRSLLTTKRVPVTGKRTGTLFPPNLSLPLLKKESDGLFEDRNFGHDREYLCGT